MMIKLLESSRGVSQGKTMGRWTVLGVPFRIRARKYSVVARCECGNVCVVRCDDLASGQSHGCNECGSRDSHRTQTVHGDTAGKQKRLYTTWLNMKSRCYNSGSSYYHCYGKRGISVCDEWLNNYESFRSWSLANGYSDELQIDRINNDGNYEPSNCRWVTSKQNGRNTRHNVLLTAFGEEKCLSAWAEDRRCRVAYRTLRLRIIRNWSPERAITAASRNEDF